MNAFGRRNNPGGIGSGTRPTFGVARPMQGGTDPAGKATGAPLPGGGDQFPPIPTHASPEPESAHKMRGDAMSRLTDRANAVHETNSEQGGFEASIHKIKEQVLPRLLERVDPEAAATLTKDELSEEFRPIIMEVLADL